MTWRQYLADKLWPVSQVKIDLLQKQVKLYERFLTGKQERIAYMDETGEVDFQWTDLSTIDVTDYRS